MIGSSFYNADSLFATLDRTVFHINRGDNLEVFFKKKDKRKKLILLNKVTTLDNLEYQKSFKDAIWLIFDVPLNLKQYGLDIIDGEHIDNEIIWKPKKLSPASWNKLLNDADLDFNYKKQEIKTEKSIKNSLGMKSIFKKKKGK